MRETEPNPEAKAAEPIPEDKARTPSEVTPQLIKRVHEFYEEIGREEVRAVLALENAEREIPKDETKAEPKPEAKAAEPKPEAKAAEPATGPKAAKPKREFRNKIIFALSIVGVLAALVAAYFFGMERKAQPPVFKPVSSPYESAIYANGIIESDQSSGETSISFLKLPARSSRSWCAKASRCRSAPRCSPSTIPCRDQPQSSPDCSPKPPWPS
jgi:hypothetical protein